MGEKGEQESQSITNSKVLGQPVQLSRVMQVTKPKSRNDDG